MRNKQLRILTEASVMIALSTVLSFIKIFQLPWGGSITLLSMLPITLFSIRRGVKNGAVASFAFALIQLLLGFTVDGLAGWGLTPAAMIGCILLDYLIPYTLLGLAGIFGNKSLASVLSGTVAVIVLRLVSHVVSGSVIFHSLGLIWNINIDNSWLYSLVYNSCYMVPELVLTMIGAIVIYSVSSTRKLLCNAN